MNQEIKKEWCAKLRSGEYAQGTGALRLKGNPNDRYCCLGVLCDIYAKKTLADNAWTPVDSMYDAPRYSFLDSQAHSSLYTSYLPAEVVDWAELKNMDPLIFDKGTLSDINDKGYDFAYIADLIEKYL